MLEYINENGDIYTEEEIKATAAKKGTTFDDIVARNGLRVNNKKNVKTQPVKQQKPINKPEPAPVQKKSQAKKNVWDMTPFDPTKEIIKQSQKNITPQKKKPVTVKPKVVEDQQYVTTDDLFDNEEAVAKNLAEKLALFGLTPEETTGTGDYGTPRFNAITIRGARKNMLGKAVSKEGYTEADLPAVRVGRDISREELKANAKILNEYIKAHGDKNFLETAKAKHAKTLSKADATAAPKSRTFEEKLKVYNQDMISEFENKERNRKEQMQQETPYGGKSAGPAVLSEKDFDDTSAYKAYKLWKQGMPIPIPSTEKLEGHIKKVNEKYRDYQFARFTSDLDPEARVALTALNVDRKAKQANLESEGIVLNKKIEEYNKKGEELLKTKPTREAVMAFKNEGVALGNEITSFNNNINDTKLIEAGLKATKADYSRINQTLTALKSTATDIGYGIADIATTVASAKAAVPAIFTGDFAKAYNTTKTALKPLLLDPIYATKKDLEEETESYQQNISIDTIKDSKDLGRWAAQVFTSMPSSAAMAVTGELSLPLFFTSGFGQKGFEIEAKQEQALDRLEKNLSDLENNLISADQIQSVQEQIAIDRKTLNISEGAKITSKLIAGSAEVVFEKLGDLKILKQTKKALDLIPPTEIKAALKEFGKQTIASLPREFATEGATQVTNNFGDIYILGEDKNLFDGVLEAGASGALMGPVFSAIGGSSNITNAVVSEMRSKKEIKDRSNKINELRKITGLADLPSNITMDDVAKLELTPEVKKIVSEVVTQIENEDAEVLARLGKDLSLADIQELGNLNQQARRIRKEFNTAMQNPSLSDSELKTLKDYYEKKYNETLEARENILGDEAKRKETNKEYTKETVSLNASEGWNTYAVRLTAKSLMDAYQSFDKLPDNQKQEYYGKITNEEDPAKIKQAAKQLYVDEKVGAKIKKDAEIAKKFAEDSGLDINFTIAEGEGATNTILEAAKVVYAGRPSEYKAFKEAIENGTANGIYENGQVLIHLPNAVKNGAIGVGSHETLHGLTENGFKLNAEKANQAGLVLLDYLKSAQPDLYASVSERLKAYEDADGNITVSNYGEEVMNALSDAFKDGSVPKESVLTKLSNWINTVTGGKIGQPSSTLNMLTMDTTDGSNVYNIIKDYNLATQTGAKQKKSTARVLVSKPDREEQGTQKFSKSANTITVYHGGQLTDYGTDQDLYVTENKRQAGYYAKGNEGDVFAFDVDKDKIAGEDVARQAIESLGLQTPSKDYTNDELKLHELIDPRFETTALSKGDIKKVYKELESKGFEGISFTDEDLEGSNRGVGNIVMFGKKPDVKSVSVNQFRADELFANGYKPIIKGEVKEDFTQEQLDDYFESNEAIEMTKPKTGVQAKFSKSNLQGLFDKYGKNKTRFINESLSKTPGGKYTYDLTKSEFGTEIGGLVESITRRLYDGIPEDSKRMVTRMEYKDALISNAATIISKEYDPAKQGLDAFISNRLNLRANKLASELGIEGAEEGGFKLDVEEAKGIVAEEAPVAVKEAPKYRTILENKVFKPEVIESVTKKLLTTVRTLKTRVDEPVSINRTITPFIAEIKDAMGKQADIDIKKEMGGKPNDQFKNFLLKNKKTILENMTTAWLSGKDVKGKVEGGIPEAIQKQIDGKWVSYPDWAGKKIDRETVNTDLAGRTSGNEITRRLPNAANNVSDEAFLGRFIEQSGDLIRGRKESLSKAMAEEVSFDILKESILNETEIYDALASNQERLGAVVEAVTFEEISKQADRGNIKFSLSPNMRANVASILASGYDGSMPMLDVIAENKLSDKWIRYRDELLNKESTRVQREKDIKKLEKILSESVTVANLMATLAKFKNDRTSAKHEANLRKQFSKVLDKSSAVVDKNSKATQSAASPDVNIKTKIGQGKNSFTVDTFIEAKASVNAQLASKTINVDPSGFISLPDINSFSDYAKEEFLKLQDKLNSNGGTKEYFKSASMISQGVWEIPATEYYRLQAIGAQKNATVQMDMPLAVIAEMYNKKNNAAGTHLLVIGESVFTFDKNISMESGVPLIIGSEALLKEVEEYNNENPDNKINFVPGIATATATGRVVKAAGYHTKANSSSKKETHVRYHFRVIPTFSSKTKTELNNFIKNSKNNVKITDNNFNNKLQSVVEYNLLQKQLQEGEIKNDRFKNYNKAKTKSYENSINNTEKKIRVFDFDDTLARTKSNVLYTMPNGTDGFDGPKKLTAAEYAKNGDLLASQGAIFDFSEFSKVVDGKKGPLFGVAKYIAENTKGDMFVLTARPADSKYAIHDFLTSLGLNIPVDNIVGLGNSDPNAKADWMVSKVAEGYNDFYFADDHLANVNAVKAALETFDIKSRTQQAKIKFSRSMNLTFNKMLETKKGAPRKKVYSDIEARRAGKGKGKFRIFMPASAEDFSGLLYNFLNKGAQGEADMKFFEEALINPYTDAIAEMEAGKQAMKRDFKKLKNLYPEVAAKLGKKIPSMEFTYDQAIRVAMWTKLGYEIPGISKSEIRKLNKVVNSDAALVDFSKVLNVLGNRDTGWTPPKDYWEADTIVSELNNMTEKEGRKVYLQEFIDNSEIIFSPENLNKIEALYGSKFRNALEDSLYRMINGTNRSSGSSRIVNSWLNWVNNSTGAIMFLNTKSALLQTIGSVNFLNWTDNNPYRAAKALANQKQYWQDFATLWNSDKLKERRQGLKEDVAAAEIANAANGASNKPKAAFAYLLKIGFTPTQIADSFAICAGGATFYRNRMESYKAEHEGLDADGKLKRKYTDAEAADLAFKDFSKTSDQSQQSADPMLISQEQGTVLGRLILAFGNTSMQYNRLMKKAVLDLANGRGDAKTHVSKILYYGAIQNIMFSALQNGLSFALFGGDDEDDEAKKKQRDADISKKSIDALDNTLDSLLRGSGLAGATVATIKNLTQEYLKQREKGPGKEDSAEILLAATSISPPINSKLRKLNSAYKTIKFDQDVMDKRGWEITADGRLNLSPKYSVLGNVTSAVTNIPLDRAVSKVNNMAEAFDSRNAGWQRIASGLGWNSYSLGVKNEEEDIIKAEAREIRKEASIEKAYEKREALKDSIRSLRGLERRNYLLEEREKKRDNARRKRERALKRRMGE